MEMNEEKNQEIQELEYAVQEQPQKPKKRWKKILLIVLLSLLGLIIAAAVTVLIMGTRLLNLMPRTDSTLPPMSPSEMEAFLQDNTDPYDPNFSDESIAPEDVTWDTTPPEIEQGADIINILLIGSDTRVAGQRARSDTMILCTLNKNKNTMTLTSFMRDMYVQIPGYSDNRINASYAFGGMETLNKTMEKNFGVKIDGNFLVDFESFKDVIDVIGGVPIDLTQAEVNYMNNTKYWTGLDREKTDLNFHVGVNVLNGTEALHYARNRSVGGTSDFGRTERQRNVMVGVFNKSKNLSPLQMYRMLEKLLPLMTTNLDNETILKYAAQVIPMMSGLQLKTARIPVDGGYRNAWVGKMAVLIPNLEVNRRALQEILAPAD